MQSPRGGALLLFAIVAAGLSAISSSSPDSIVNGIVTDEDGPVAGAIVRRQGGKTCTRTDVQGRFRMPASKERRLLTAAKEGYLIAASQQPRLSLTPLRQDDNDDYAWMNPAPDPARPLQCGNCHAEIYREWAGSAHAQTARNPKFLAIFAGTNGSAPPARKWNLLAEHPLGSGVCAACHAPTLSSPDLDYDVRQAGGVAGQGVHCDYCHKIAEAPTDKLGTRFGRDGYRLLRPHGAEQLFFGPLDDAVRPGESFAYAPFYRESRYCASCHEGLIFGVHVYGTYSEWLASPARREGKQCQDCHMTPNGAMTNIARRHGGVERDPRTLASHDFPGASRAMLGGALEVKPAVLRRGKDVVVEVMTIARQVGHRVPTGFIDRHLILVVEARDGAGQALSLVDGPVLPSRAGPALAKLPGWIFGKQHLEASGAPLPFWQSAAESLDTRLQPEQPDRRRFVFPADTAALRVRLIYRRFWEELARSRAWNDHETVVWDLALPVKE